MKPTIRPYTPRPFNRNKMQGLPPSLDFNMVIVSMIWLAILLILAGMFTGYHKLYVLAVGDSLLIMAGIGIKMIGRRLRG